MSVIAYPKGYGGGVDHELREEVKKLSNKVDRIIAKLDEDNLVRKVENGSFVIKCKSNLVWWTKVDGAARYCLTLSIDGEEVGVIDLEREIRYHVFEKMPNGINYIVKVVSEDRGGKEIVSATFAPALINVSNSSS